MNIKENSFADKVFGSLYGFAIGDAMGATTEFMSELEIRRSFGKVTDIIGGGWLRLSGGQVTDDTQMSLCVMDALMSDNFESRVKQNFIAWYKSGPIDIGCQCSKGISYLVADKHIPIESDALGNGALMRALPCALYGSEKKNLYQEMLTHNNVTNEKCIKAYHKRVQFYLSHSSKFHGYIGQNALVEPRGCILNTLNNALIWSSCSTSFEESIIGPVNHGGDSDTIAAITGGLSGARWGFNQIPKRWIEQLNDGVKEQLNIFAEFVITKHQETI